MGLLIMIIINMFLLFLVGKIIYLLKIKRNSFCDYDDDEYYEKISKSDLKGMLFFILFIFFSEINYCILNKIYPKIDILSRLLLTFLTEILIVLSIVAAAVIMLLAKGIIKEMIDIIKM